MDKLFREAIIINVALLVLFILSDFLTWNAVAASLNSRMQTILAPALDNTRNVTNIYSNYLLVSVGINVRYVISYLFMPPIDSVGISLNLPLVWFIVATIVNLYLIGHYGTKRLKELTETQEQKPLLPTEQKTN